MSLGRRIIRRRDSRMALTSMKPTAAQLESWIMRPRAVPAAGGCSELVTTITRMLTPTHMAASTSNRMRGSAVKVSRMGICNTRENAVPTMTATR